MTKQILSEAYFTRYDSPFGPMLLQSDGEAITALDFGESTDAVYRDFPIFDQAKEELDQYFAGTRKIFAVPTKTSGTPFQTQVWEALKEIPYGQTRCYEDIAIQIGNPKASRAIGMANNRNPISIIIPCHRVIGKDGSLVGYGGGLDTKIALLDLEQKHSS